ncbi:MAG: hypothetical protein K6T16_00680 [Candidatus Pacearchaeota archaeon]|nr:hypothetical protein [Candidatus Pacearchaeota archaeon]
MKKTKREVRVGDIFEKISEIQIYNPFIENIRTQRPDLIDRILDEEVNNSIVIHLYKNFEKDMPLINAFYERLQSFYH